MHTHVWNPPTDVYETENAVVVRVEIAGMQDEDFSVELDGRRLIIRGQRPDISERRAFHQMEIYFGEFNIEMLIPIPIETSQVEAVYSNGFLRVIMPKALPRQIAIRE